MKQGNVQISESIRAGLLLAFAGGFMDAYTYICRGGVFANAQTGNIVLMGISLAEGKWSAAGFYLIPILSFVAGILWAEVIKSRFMRSRAVHWRQIILAIELIVLIGVGFIPLGKYNAIANIAISFVCSLQVESFRKIRGNPYATTMCTGNLRSATEHIYRYKTEADKKYLWSSLQYYCVILVFIIGAAAGTVLTRKLGGHALWIACLTLALVLLLMIQKPDEGEE